MDVKNQLYIRPVSWSSVNPSAAALRTNPSLFPSIQIFGYTPDGHSIYVRIPRKSTFILKFDQEVDEDMVNNIIDILIPTSVKPSHLVPNTVIIRAPELSPIELTANPEYEGLATWTDAKQDPYGEIESLWETLEIGPYEWLTINKFSPIPGKYTSCDLNIRVDEDNIRSAPDVDLPDMFPRLLFWDIETFASKPSEFPNSKNVGDVITLISIITVTHERTNGYALVKGTVNEALVKEAVGNMVLVKATDEKDLLNKFFALYATFKPDRQIYFNGDMFDMPYVLDRLTIYDMDVPRISKILSLIPRIINHSYPTPFGQERAKTLSLPGTEIVDLIHYYRRFYPHFKNHRLDTIAKSFLGEGKTGLTIEEMMEAIRTDNPDTMAQVVDYSFVDSLRMSQLWTKDDISHKLESVSNNLGISIDTLLRSSFENIINQAVYNIDAGSVMLKGKYDTPIHLKEAQPGIYRNVYIYNYSELYRQIMLLSEQPTAVALANRLEGAPPKLIMTAFYSIYLDRTELAPLLATMLESVIKTNMIIALEQFVIRSIGPLTADWLKLIEISNCYVSVAKASYIILDKHGEIETAGLAKLCRPKFELASDIIQSYLVLVYSNMAKDFSLPNLKEQPIEKFYLTDKIGSLADVNPDSVKYKLIVQYGTPITTWVSVKYVMTTRGPVLLSGLKPEDMLDYTYYMSELSKYLTGIQALKLYGV